VLPVLEGAAMPARTGFDSSAQRYFAGAGFSGVVLKTPGSGKLAASGTG
jgi:hypothetical protein